MCRYLQTLTQISQEKNSTIVFPLPLELFSLIPVTGAHPGHSRHCSCCCGSLQGFSDKMSQRREAPAIEDERKTREDVV